jgi:serine/threonine-protein kinase
MGAALLALLAAGGAALWQARQTLPRDASDPTLVATASAPALAPPQVAASGSLAPGEELLPDPPTPAQADSTRPAAPGARTPAGQRGQGIEPGAPSAPATARSTRVAASTGTVQLAISPWGEIEVDGKALGTAPPLTRLSLPVGHHTVTVRNGDFAPLVRSIDVDGLKPISLKHRFGP